MTTYIINGSETFTFEAGMIEKVSSTIDIPIDENTYAQVGPLGNQGVDVNGCVKTITVSGRLVDATSTVSDTQDIRDKKVMKFWLESLGDGNQVARVFYSNYENSSVLGQGTDTITDDISGQSITVPANFSTTKVYVKQIRFDEEEGNPEEIPFTLTLWVAGQ